MEKVSTNGPITQTIMENGVTVKCTDLALSVGQTEENTWVNSKRISKMAMEQST